MHYNINLIYRVIKKYGNRGTSQKAGISEENDQKKSFGFRSTYSMLTSILTWMTLFKVTSRPTFVFQIKLPTLTLIIYKAGNYTVGTSGLMWSLIDDSFCQISQDLNTSQLINLGPVNYLNECPPLDQCFHLMHL